MRYSNYAISHPGYASSSCLAPSLLHETAGLGLSECSASMVSTSVRGLAECSASRVSTSVRGLAECSASIVSTTVLHRMSRRARPKKTSVDLRWFSEFSSLSSRYAPFRFLSLKCTLLPRFFDTSTSLLLLPFRQILNYRGRTGEIGVFTPTSQFVSVALSPVLNGGWVLVKRIHREGVGRHYIVTLCFVG